MSDTDKVFLSYILLNISNKNIRRSKREVIVDYILCE